jgi:hypothetical protein
MANGRDRSPEDAFCSAEPAQEQVPMPAVPMCDPGQASQLPSPVQTQLDDATADTINNGWRMDQNLEPLPPRPAERAPSNPETDRACTTDVVAGALDVATGSADYLDAMPGVGELYSAVQLPYNAGQAIYDAATGDRDGAIDHAVRTPWNFVGALPGGSELVGGIDLALASNATTVRGAMGAMGIDGGDQVPGSLEDISAMTAVAATNMIFGADNTNWSPLTDGDTPEGTRQGEIISGLAGIGMVATPIAAAEAALVGWGGTELAQSMGLGPDDTPGSTTGAQPGVAARLGQTLHRELGIERAWQAASDWWE